MIHKKSIIHINWDALGMFTSIACAIHCAFLPIFLTTLPVFGINIIHNEAFEWGMIGLAVLVGAYSLGHGYKKHHQSFIPVCLFLTGAFFLVLKQLDPKLEYFFLAIAVIFILTAHFINYRMIQQQKGCGVTH